MRQIKFRAWDKRTKEMVYPNKNESWVLLKHFEMKKILELMQFTGLKDKNGNKIYEGDIVKWEDDVISQIIWKSPCMIGINNGKYALDYYTTYDNHNLEVIGNIYENPKLLKEEE